MLRTGKAGQLKKGQNGNVGNLRDRWFVSEGFHVQYFESSTSKKRCSRFDLRNIKLVRPVADAREAVEFLVVEGKASKSIAIAFDGLPTAEKDEWLSLWTSALESHSVHPSLLKYRSQPLADQFNNDHHDAPVLISTVRHSQNTILTPRVPAVSSSAVAAAPIKGLELPPDEFMADPVMAGPSPSNEIDERREANLQAKEEMRRQREREIDARREANIRAREQLRLQKEIERKNRIAQTVEPPAAARGGPPPDAGREDYPPATGAVASAVPAQVRLQRAASAEEPVELELAAYVPLTASADRHHDSTGGPVQNDGASETVPSESQAKEASACRLVQHAASSASLEYDGVAQETTSITDGRGLEDDDASAVPIEDPEPFEVDVTLDTLVEPVAEEPRPAAVHVTLMESPEPTVEHGEREGDGGDDGGSGYGGADFGDHGGEAYEDSDNDTEEDEGVPGAPSLVSVASLQASGEQEGKGTASAYTVPGASVPAAPPVAAPAPPPSGGFQAMKALQLAELEAQLEDEARSRQRARKEATARARAERETNASRQLFSHA